MDCFEKLKDATEQLAEFSKKFDEFLDGMRAKVERCPECGSGCDTRGRCVAQCNKREILEVCCGA
jgi:uncharacterized protein with PIN domain